MGTSFQTAHVPAASSTSIHSALLSTADPFPPFAAPVPPVVPMVPSKSLAKWSTSSLVPKISWNLCWWLSIYLSTYRLTLIYIYLSIYLPIIPGWTWGILFPWVNIDEQLVAGIGGLNLRVNVSWDDDIPSPTDWKVIKIHGSQPPISLEGNSFTGEHVPLQTSDGCFSKNHKCRANSVNDWRVFCWTNVNLRSIAESKKCM